MIHSVLFDVFVNVEKLEMILLVASYIFTGSFTKDLQSFCVPVTQNIIHILTWWEIFFFSKIYVTLFFTLFYYLNEFSILLAFIMSGEVKNF